MPSPDWKVPIPKSSSTVNVSIIDTTTYLLNTTDHLTMVPHYDGYEKIDIPSYSFLIHNEAKDKRLLFDLGLRTDWATKMSPHVLEEIKPFNLTIVVEKDTADILRENGVEPDQINGIIYSHHHWDHVGDATKFPGHTSIIVGPGYKAKYLPGWPADPDSGATMSDLYEGRETIEPDFSSNDPRALKLGEYEANDWFGDGSFYILNTPGHTTGHLCALARTTSSTTGESTFVFLGGDVSHHGALFRPTEYLPIPETISPAPYDPPTSTGSCPGEIYASIHRYHAEGKGYSSPFCIMKPDGPVDEDPALAQKTLDKIHPFDGDDDIFTIYAHDGTLLDIVDFFPKNLNAWKEKNWGKLGHWRFLGQLKVDKK